MLDDFKLGKAGKATAKADTTLPYNAMKIDKLKDTVKANVYANVQQKTEQASAFWQSNFSKEAINKTIEAAKHSAVMTKAKNTLNSVNIKETATKTYEDVVKTPIAKTQAAWEKKKDQLLDMPLPNLGLAPVPLGPTANRTVREGIEAAQHKVMQIVGNKEVGGETTKGTGEVSKKISYIPNVKEAKNVIAERTKGLDLNEHPTTTKQMSSKKMKELKDKVDNRTITKQEYADYIWNKKFAKRRDKGVKEFWYQEQQRLLNNESLTRDWSQEQLKDILAGKTPKFDGKPIAGHHSYSASKHPHLADKGEIIYPATFNEHLKGWHGGNWRNSIPGEPIKPIKDF